MEKLTSRDMKVAALAHFRYKRQFHYVATEVGAYSSDVVVICTKKNRFIELEVKISKADLVADFKKRKHEIYLECKNQKELPKRKWRQQWIPREFYFLVPEYLTEYAVNAVEELPYGVYEYRHPKYTNSYGSGYQDRLKMVVKAKRLHTHTVSEQDIAIKDIVSRMGSELCRAYIDFQEYKESEYKISRN